MSRNYVWTCQGCTDLAQKIDSDWNSFFKLLLDLKAKITRLDLALDDYNAVVDFEKIEHKLKSGDYRSSKKSYNVIKEFYLILNLFIGVILLQFYHLLYQSLLHFL